LVPRATVTDLENTARRRPTMVYALTKLAIVLFTMELHRRYHARGVSAATFHPGFVSSNFGDASGLRFLYFMEHRVRLVNRFIATTDQAAERLVWLASSRPGIDWRPGEYYVKNKIAKANRLAYDPVLARELWDRTMAKLS
jgi:NAD(P)-dependent dehydrogenase (short-subunit alcohol dehydrogenase family)